MRMVVSLTLSVLVATAGVAKESRSPVTRGPDGRLVYEVLEHGDRVPDFSHAGYGGGGVVWPEAAARVLVAPVEGDDGARIQAAIDYVSAQAPGAAGLRGAVQLERGSYEIAGRLKIAASGVVLRGAGPGEAGTVLVATGVERRTLIEVAGVDAGREPGVARRIVDDYVPVGENQLRVADAGDLAVGRRVTVERPSPAAWLARLGMDDGPARQPYRWKPGTVNVRWDRVITAIAGDRLTLDAPLTTSLERELGGGTVTAFVESGQITRVGVENLRIVSACDSANPLDEEHAWNGIDLRAVRDAWVADVTGEHLAGGLVLVGEDAARVTVRDCVFLAPVSESAGFRRMAFHTRGQQTLFVRCRSEAGKNDFTAGHATAGPTVFLDCVARDTRGFSGSVGAWASGLLFDGVKIDGGALRLDNLETFNQGVGWAAANSMVWRGEAGVIVARQPPGAHNWAVGVWGQFVGDGRWSQTNQFLRPESLYRAQLVERLGAESLAALASRAYPEFTGVPTLEQVVHDLAARLAPKSPAPGRPLALVDGVLTVGGVRMSGRQTAGAWWQGRTEPDRAADAGPALTRFAPGRTGPGLTDDLSALAEQLAREGVVAFRHHPGLWYDRRRIDHQMVRRPDGEVWPPFLEQPFARSGSGTAWDGLSRYDLTKYNPWYFGRLRAFAGEARRLGLVLVAEMYFQHNVLESGAHWVDSPWRPVNNVNATGFTEPPPFEGDTIKLAAEFYDTTHSVRRELHRAYIRQCLAALADEPNVIHTLTSENSGPLAFNAFWLDVVAEWERETGRHPLIALSAPKDVQDALLADTARAAVVDVIDLTYWFRTDDGAEFAPPGGVDLAPRQQARRWKGGRPTAASIAAMARKYREKFPGKAVITGLDEAGDIQP